MIEDKFFESFVVHIIDETGVAINLVHHVDNKLTWFILVAIFDICANKIK